MADFIMMCGIPASGKTTLAKGLSKRYNAVVLSSDEIREELFNNVNNQEHNSKVFEIMNERTKTLLENGFNVIYDATNISRKRRMHLINNIVTSDKKIVYCIISDFKDCVLGNLCRERTISQSVIERMYKSFQIPTKNEGWDEVIFHYANHRNMPFSRRKHIENVITEGLDHDRLFINLKKAIPIFNNIYNIPHDSKYHSFSISRHTYYAYKYILDNYHSDDKLMMLWAALLHDIGKSFCKSFENYKGETQRYANFIGHEYVSAQMAIQWLYVMGYDDQFIKDVADLIQFHMIPMKAGDKKMEQVKRLMGDELYQKLLILHEADMQAK